MNKYLRNKNLHILDRINANEEINWAITGVLEMSEFNILECRNAFEHLNNTVNRSWQKVQLSSHWIINVKMGEQKQHGENLTITGNAKIQFLLSDLYDYQGNTYPGLEEVTQYLVCEYSPFELEEICEFNPSKDTLYTALGLVSSDHSRNSLFYSDSVLACLFRDLHPESEERLFKSKRS
jgi:hypothetical protein